MLAVDALGGLVVKEAVYAFKLGWTSKANLLAHFGKHGSEFGFRMAESYGAAAQKLIASAGEEGVEAIVTSQGEKMVFNKATREFAMVNKEGEIATYFKARQRYWNKRVSQAASAASGGAQ